MVRNGRDQYFTLTSTICMRQTCVVCVCVCVCVRARARVHTHFFVPSYVHCLLQMTLSKQSVRHDRCRSILGREASCLIFLPHHQPRMHITSNAHTVRESSTLQQPRDTFPSVKTSNIALHLRKQNENREHDFCR